MKLAFCFIGTAAVRIFQIYIPSLRTKNVVHCYVFTTALLFILSLGHSTSLFILYQPAGQRKVERKSKRYIIFEMSINPENHRVGTSVPTKSKIKQNSLYPIAIFFKIFRNSQAFGHIAVCRYQLVVLCTSWAGQNMSKSFFMFFFHCPTFFITS